MIKVGKVKYLNTMPLFYRWEDPQIQLVLGHPSELALMLRKGELQAGIISSVEYLTNQALYTYVPDVSISSKDRVCSVLLFSRLPIEQVSRVYLTPNSITSKYLCIYLLEEIYKLKPVYTERKDSADCLLLIGDEALYEKKAGRFPYVYDLAYEWYRRHHLPFVFALFIVRKDAPEWLFQRIKELCHISVKAFFKDLEERKIKVDGFSQEELFEYFTQCLYNGLNEKEELSLRIFMEFLSSRGLL
ncbi:Chorismate dehydratase [bacterium HR13]|nr:Chorismate dehydratase [bacterium HR13]